MSKFVAETRIKRLRCKFENDKAEMFYTYRDFGVDTFFSFLHPTFFYAHTCHYLVVIITNINNVWNCSTSEYHTGTYSLSSLLQNKMYTDISIGTILHDERSSPQILISNKKKNYNHLVFFFSISSTIPCFKKRSRRSSRRWLNTRR